MKIIAYDDNPDFGGHQIMACHGIEALAKEPSTQIICMINPANQKLIDRLSEYTIVAPNHDLRTLAPDLVLCTQGDITQSKNGILAAKRADLECVSYLALPHPMAHMGSKLGAFRDLKTTHLINAPDRFITISESMKQLLIERGCTKPITVVPNGIPAPRAPNRKPQTVNCTIGLIGRIEFKQKQQDFMVRTFLNQPVFKECRLLIAGSGPNEEQLRKMINGHENITLLPWQKDIDAFFSKIDVLVIPSRYEGVPLVMLEALARGIPVIGSDRDGMQEVLPNEWTFATGNAEALADTFAYVQKNRQNGIPALRQRVLANHSLDTFKANFANAVFRRS